MTEGMGHVIDPAGVARGALQAAVAGNGPGILSNAVMLDDFCRDRLVGLPGEAVLISSAARSDVPGLLRQQTGTLGLDAAIASVAATLSQAHSLDDTASVWVVTEFARALGYPVPARAEPMIVMPQPPAATLPLPPPGSGGLTDQGDALPPGPAPATQAWGAGFGTAGSGGPTGPTQPLGPPGPPGPGGPRRGGIMANRNVLGLVAAILVVGAYLGIAAAAGLSPFAKSSNTTPTPNPSNTGLGLVGGDRSVPGRGPDGTRANPGPVTVTRYAGVPDLAAGALPGWLFTTAQRAG